jgi:hypothetical protein
LNGAVLELLDDLRLWEEAHGGVILERYKFIKSEVTGGRLWSVPNVTSVKNTTASLDLLKF